MTEPGASPRRGVRIVVGPQEVARRERELWLGALVCDALLIAVVLVGVMADWAWWVIAAGALLPLVVGSLALRAAVVLRRQASGRPPG